MRHALMRLHLKSNSGSVCNVSSANYSIEIAAPEHLAAIAAIEQAAAAMFPEADLPGELRYRVTCRGALSKARYRGRLWVALAAERRPVGFAMANILDGHAHLEEMDVHPAHARRGLGSRLVSTVIEWAQEEGYV